MKKLNVKPIIKKSDAWTRGFNAFCYGTQIEKNPYSIDHGNHKEFGDGLFEAQKQFNSTKPHSLPQIPR